MSFLSKLQQLIGSGNKAGNKKKLPRVDIAKRFELLNKTGQGSMSNAFRARDRKTGRMVCVKILDKVETAKFEARFVGLKRPLEGEICIILRHPNIVKTYEYAMTTAGEQFLVMELVDGMGLNFLIETHSPKLDGERNNYMIQMAEGVEYIHQQRYLHRDICPRNTMVNQEGEVKIIDFGLAIPYLPDFCKPGNRTGTADYLAPEVIKRLTTDHRVDLFALGVTAYEVFTGQLPWEKGDSAKTLHNHVNRPGDDPRKYQPKLPEKTAKFLMKAIERDPRQRFQSAADFRDALKTLPKQ